MLIRGSICAIVTPMFEDGTVDYDTYAKLIEWHISEGTNCICSVGTTGEGPTLSVEEHIRLVETAVKTCAGRVPVLAGAGCNCTSHSIELAREVKRVGASASLQVVPYYNKPTQDGLYQHFRAIAEAVDLPVVLYNVPGRTVCDIKNDTVLRLVKDVPSIIGLKDAVGDLARTADLLRRLPKGREFAVYSGNDDSAVSTMLLGGSGVISVTANVAPRLMSQMAAAALSGDIKTALEINNRLYPLHKKLFCEPNPIAPKWALYRMGKIPANGIRLPLTPLTEAGQKTVEAAMKEASIL